MTRQDAAQAHAKDFMRTHIFTVHPDTRVKEAVATLIKHKISGAPVVDSDHKLVGVFSELDALKAEAGRTYYASFGDPTGTVSQHMTSEVESVTPEADVWEVTQIFETKHIRRVVVTDENGKLVGLISRGDLLRFLHNKIELRPPHKTPGAFGIGGR